MRAAFCVGETFIIYVRKLTGTENRRMLKTFYFGKLFDFLKIVIR